MESQQTERAVSWLTVHGITDGILINIKYAM